MDVVLSWLLLLVFICLTIRSVIPLKSQIVKKTKNLTKMELIYESKYKTFIFEFFIEVAH